MDTHSLKPRRAPQKRQRDITTRATSWHITWGSRHAERLGSRTYQRRGYMQLPVLKTGWRSVDGVRGVECSGVGLPLDRRGPRRFSADAGLPVASAKRAVDRLGVV